MMRIRRRAVAVAAFAVAVALALAGCAPGAGGSGSDSDKTTLTVWSWRTEDVAGYKKIFALYEKANPGVTVDFKAFKNTEYDTVLSTGLAGSGGPDIAQLRAGAALVPVVAAKRIVPIDAATVPSLADLDASVLKGAQVPNDKKVYGVPFALQTLQMYYNKDIFKAQGLTVPTTWQEFLAANEKLKSAGLIPIAATAKDNWMLPVTLGVVGGTYWAAGSYSDALTKGTAKLTDPGFVDSINALKTVSKYFPDNFTGVSYTEAQTLFTAGKAAMFPGGSWELGPFTASSPNLHVGIFSVPAPGGAGTGKPVAPAFVDGSFGVSTASKQQKATLKLLNWMGTREFGQAFADNLKQITPIKNVSPADPGLKTIIANYQEHPGGYLPASVFSGGNPDTQTVLAGALQEMFVGSGDPASVAKTYADAVAKAFPDGR